MVLVGILLLLAALDEDWLSERIARGEITVAHVRLGEDIVLTGATGEIREFLVHRTRDEGAFTRILLLVRSE